MHLKSGDHVVCSNAVFGATMQLFSTSSRASAIETTYVSPTRSTSGAGDAANTRLCLPRDAVQPAHRGFGYRRARRDCQEGRGAAPRSTTCSARRRCSGPLELGADLVVHSATKYLDGQGRVIAGAVAGSKALVGDPITAFLRTAGPTLSPFNAWVVLKGLETLELRMRAQSAAALELARWLEAHPNVARVHYPGLESHPQHALAKRQQRAAARCSRSRSRAAAPRPGA
jgi:O-succinylhomoserine sulfhydrylase